MNNNDPVVTSSAAIIINDPAREGLRQLEHFAEFGRLSASLLHEISNPLTAALLYLEQYENRQSRHIRQVRRNILLLQRYVEAARQQIRHEGEISSFYIRAQIDQVRRVLAPLARRKGVSLQIEPATNYKIFGDPVKFQQILANLIINAIDSYDTSSAQYPHKLVTVTVDSQRQWLLLKIVDKGAGIPAQQLAQIFEPFYTTKARRGQGLGIGLAVVRQHVEHDFGGSVVVSSSASRGTIFTVRLRLTPRYH